MNRHVWKNGEAWAVWIICTVFISLMAFGFGGQMEREAALKVGAAHYVLVLGEKGSSDDGVKFRWVESSEKAGTTEQKPGLDRASCLKRVRNILDTQSVLLDEAQGDLDLAEHSDAEIREAMHKVR
jgi:hypothetical protein